MIVHDKCTFVDQQTIKLQEAPDMVPTGELPRHLILSVDRYLTGKVVPGSRIVATGVYSTFQAGKGRVRPQSFPFLSDSAHSVGPLSSEIHLSLSEHLIYEYWDWKSIEKELEEEGLEISRRRKRRNLKRWVNNQGFMRSLREVSLQVSLETMVRLDHSVFRGFVLTHLAIPARRHQEIDRLSAVRWIEEGASRRYAITRRYQRPDAGRSRNCQISTPQVRREGVSYRCLHEWKG